MQSESDDETSGDEFEDQPLSLRFDGKVEFEISSSIYDVALVVPLFAGRKSWLISSMIVLAMNYVLQVVVIQKIADLSVSRKEQMIHDLFHVCQTYTLSEFPFKNLSNHRRLAMEDRIIYDCGPASVTVFSDLSQLDLNADGIWALREAQELENRWLNATGKTKHWLNLPSVFHRFKEVIRSGRLPWKSTQPGCSASKIALTPSEALVDEQISMKWLQKWGRQLQLCAAADSRICPNLEARGILKLQEPECSDEAQRISSCEAMLDDICPALFGERFKLYRAYSQSLCGTARTVWLQEEGIRGVKFSSCSTYNDEEGVTANPYHFFLVIVEIVWATMIVRELRRLYERFVVLLFIKEQEPEEQSFFRNKYEDFKRISHIPRGYKFFLAVSNLLPRLLISLWLGWNGSKYLIRSDDYNELLLNCVAFGFLLEIPDYLGAAVIGTTSDNAIKEQKSLEVEYHHRAEVHSCSRLQSCLDFQLPLAPLRAIAILFFAFVFVHFSYIKDKGKYEIGEALMCLCQVAGDTCVASQLFGGAPELFRWTPLHWQSDFWSEWGFDFGNLGFNALSLLLT